MLIGRESNIWLKIKAFSKIGQILATVRFV
jgi:hypothetical protein